uniref:ribonuclease P protein subunit p25-like protein n=1 Tax=Ciona intestinalis TaxID=7719 RepID=UPI0002B8D6F9|nr:ribonuclease P protein subunit p25-like protein [Ciona intestinalis]|eukprot:XP_004226620.1 ribonuclease P protein subunit p25-like protein [Ciona intestinalis]
MEYYEKFKSVNHEVVNPFRDVLHNEPNKVVEVRISSHTIMNKVVGYAMRKLKDPNCEIALLIGQDSGVDKTKKLAEILRSKFPALHQCNAMSNKVHEDIWLPKVEKENELDALSVKRCIPVIYILLAKGELPEKLKSHPNRKQISGEQKLKFKQTPI